jgi:transcriptional regulator with XRE-family HTH domain
MTPDETCELFGRRVREARRARKWSLRDLGEKASLSLPVLWRAEAGAGITLRSALLIAGALEIPAAELLAEPETAEAAP